MTGFTLGVEGHKTLVGDLAIPPLPAPPPPSLPQLWRVRHDKELGPLWRLNLPEVHPFSPGHFTPFYAGWQWLSFDINQPWLDAKHWTALYSCHRAFTNNQAWDCRCAANFVEGDNLTCELPKVEALVCGGAYLKGQQSFSLRSGIQQVSFFLKAARIIGAFLGLRAKIVNQLVSNNVLIVETLDGRGAPPAISWLMERRWLFFDAVTIGSTGNPHPFPQAGGHPIYIPLIASPTRYPTITFPLWKLQKWNMDVPLASPYEILL